MIATQPYIIIDNILSRLDVIDLVRMSETCKTFNQQTKHYIYLKLGLSNLTKYGLLDGIKYLVSYREGEMYQLVRDAEYGEADLLATAICYGHLDIVKYFIDEMRVDPEGYFRLDGDDWFALGTAIYENRHDIVQYLLSLGNRIKFSIEEWSHHSFDYHDLDLCFAVMVHMAYIRLLISKKKTIV